MSPSVVGVKSNGASDGCASASGNTSRPLQGRVNLGVHGTSFLGPSGRHEAKQEGSFEVHCCGWLDLTQTTAQAGQEKTNYSEMADDRGGVFSPDEQWFRLGSWLDIGTAVHASYSRVAVVGGQVYEPWKFWSFLEFPSSRGCLAKVPRVSWAGKILPKDHFTLHSGGLQIPCLSRCPMVVLKASACRWVCWR